MRTALDGKVVPFCAQLRAHKSSASAILVVSFCRSAALQQSISIIPPMLHSFSPKCSGTPANALPARTSKRKREARRFFMFNGRLYSKRNCCQATGITPRPKGSHPLRAMHIPMRGPWFSSTFELLNTCSPQESPTLRIIPRRLVQRYGLISVLVNSLLIEPLTRASVCALTHI